MSVATGLERAWYAAAGWLWLLRPLELLFRLGVGVRRWLFSRGYLSSYRAGVPVVIVGNITVGGTGKTPVVIALVEALQGAGLRPGVVSRGYGAVDGSYPRVLHAGSEAAEVGDEPLLIHCRTGAPCVVDPDRPRAARRLERDFAVDLIISDDGLQHYALQRDFEIAILDARRRIGNGFCLPAGPLREPASRLDRVDWLLFRESSEDSGDGDADGTGNNGIGNNRVGNNGVGDKGVGDESHRVRYRPTGLVNLASGESLDPGTDTLGPRVHAVAGIGQPAQFFDTLRRLGLSPVEHVFPDHHRYTGRDLADMDDAPVIMTEKDAVKCRCLSDPERAGDIWYLRIDAQVPEALVTAVAALVKPAPSVSKQQARG